MDPSLVPDPALQVALDLMGVATFAVSGGLMAVRKGFDVVGILVLAFLTSLGGGLVRDLVIGEVPPAAFADTSYLLVPIAAAAVVFVAHGPLSRLRRGALLFDAIGLGLFAVSGTLKALEFGLGPLQASFMGSLTAVGGGLLRDVVARETPVLLRADATMYSVPTFVGAGVVAVTVTSDLYSSAIGIGVVVGVVAWRLAALRFGWHAPTALRLRRRTS
jgi:uncharacterized membrane protein YeiH